jgi:hypothetical protein
MKTYIDIDIYIISDLKDSDDLIAYFNRCYWNFGHKVQNVSDTDCVFYLEAVNTVQNYSYDCDHTQQVLQFLVPLMFCFKIFKQVSVLIDIRLIELKFSSNWPCLNLAVPDET